MKTSRAGKSIILNSLIAALVLFPHIDLSGENESIGSELSEQIISKIYKKYIPVYKKYTGVQSLRNIDIIEYNPDSTVLINRTNIAMIRKDYFYKNPEITILRYILNDTRKRPSDYVDKEMGPGNLVIDENGRNLYLTRIRQFATVSNQKCYQMQVIPRQRKSENFEGYMYFDTDTLNLVLIEGTLGSLPYSFTEYSMKQYFDHLQDLPVMKSGSCIMRTHIPVLVPDRRMVFSIKVLNNAPLTD